MQYALPPPCPPLSPSPRPPRCPRSHLCPTLPLALAWRAGATSSAAQRPAPRWRCRARAPRPPPRRPVCAAVAVAAAARRGCVAQRGLSGGSVGRWRVYLPRARSGGCAGGGWFAGLVTYPSPPLALLCLFQRAPSRPPLCCRQLVRPSAACPPPTLPPPTALPPLLSFLPRRPYLLFFSWSSPDRPTSSFPGPPLTTLRPLSLIITRHLAGALFPLALLPRPPPPRHAPPLQLPADNGGRPYGALHRRHGEPGQPRATGAAGAPPLWPSVGGGDGRYLCLSAVATHAAGFLADSEN